MDWRDVGRIVAPFAPTLGSIIGGLIPLPGASIAGQALGSIIARQFGVQDTPDSVAAALQGKSNEVVLAKLRAATEEAKAKWPASAEIAKAHAEVEERYFETIQKSVSEVNTTMRAQIGREHWYYSGWRPFIGWVFAIEALGFGTLLIIGGWRAVVSGDTAGLDIIGSRWEIYAAYFAVLGAVVGVYTGVRSMDKRTAAPKQ